MTDAITAISASSELQPTAPSTSAAEPTSEIDFLAVLERIDESTQAAVQNLEAVAAGDDGVHLHELMMSLETARLELQLAVEVRNRLVEGYQELSRMQV
ncbi:MAG: flagellar hook-basal body complex protein FliE [Pseudomonadota bacterium]